MAFVPPIGALFGQRVVVGVGDLAISNDPTVTLSTYALGSCVAVVAYDPQARVAGLLHLMLPDSHIAPAKAVVQPAMFANTGLPLFFKSFSGLRAEVGRLRLFMAGGANVLIGNDAFKIGARNIRATQDYLVAQGFVLSGTAVGGSVNRTVHFDNATGQLTLKMPMTSEHHSLAT